jgi:tRNA(Arg) A34 adenosine deaminase TadA
MDEVDLRYLRTAIEVARRARQHGNDPFGALLVDEHGTILLESENTAVTTGDATGHAETNLVRVASQKYASEILVKSTLYSSCEPCAMCAGAIFYARVGRIAYALSLAQLCDVIGDQFGQLLITCREVLARGQSETNVVGPAIEAEARAVHEGYWSERSAAKVP